MDMEERLVLLKEAHERLQASKAADLVALADMQPPIQDAHMDPDLAEIFNPKFIKIVKTE